MGTFIIMRANIWAKKKFFSFKKEKYKKDLVYYSLHKIVKLAFLKIWILVILTDIQISKEVTKKNGQTIYAPKIIFDFENLKAKHWKTHSVIPRIWKFL